MKFMVHVMMVSGRRHCAICRALPGCAAYGNSREEALQGMEYVVRAYLASMDVVLPDVLEICVSGRAERAVTGTSGRRAKRPLCLSAAASPGRAG